jgi:hypothetical protein
MSSLLPALSVLNLHANNEEDTFSPVLGVLPDSVVSQLSSQELLSVIMRIIDILGALQYRV